jgi:hypothetical protein
MVKYSASDMILLSMLCGSVNACLFIFCMIYFLPACFINHVWLIRPLPKGSVFRSSPSMLNFFKISAVMLCMAKDKKSLPIKCSYENIRYYSQTFAWEKAKALAIVDYKLRIENDLIICGRSYIIFIFVQQFKQHFGCLFSLFVRVLFNRRHGAIF